MLISTTFWIISCQPVLICIGSIGLVQYVNEFYLVRRHSPLWNVFNLVGLLFNKLSTQEHYYSPWFALTSVFPISPAFSLNHQWIRDSGINRAQRNDISQTKCVDHIIVVSYYAVLLSQTAPCVFALQICNGETEYLWMHWTSNHHAAK